MISNETAIRVVRRDQAFSMLFRIGIFGGIMSLGLFGPSSGIGSVIFVTLVAGVIVRVYLGFKTARDAGHVSGSPTLIARGEFDRAEEQIESVLTKFWVFRSVKLMGLHHLAILRHAQRRWGDSAVLSRALLQQNPGGRSRGMGPITRTTRLMLADSLIEMGDLPGAYQELLALHAQKLSLHEGMNLLAVQLDYESRVGAWGPMFGNIAQKVQLAELMPATVAARTQALLALAARMVGRTDWADWLKKRAELLAPADEITSNRPILKPLWST
jgi:hypothetical protein